MLHEALATIYIYIYISICISISYYNIFVYIFDCFRCCSILFCSIRSVLFYSILLYSFIDGIGKVGLFAEMPELLNLLGIP